MDTFLEDMVLPELIKDTDKDKLEDMIISLREDVNEMPEGGKEKSMLSEDYKIISDFVKENSGNEEYLENRKELITKCKPDFSFYSDNLLFKISSQEPITTLVGGDVKEESYYHLDVNAGKPEILLGGTSKYQMAGAYGHEYTHHTQLISASDVMGLIRGTKPSDMDRIHGIFRALREGQALITEEEVSRLYSEKENDANYSRYISNDILKSMIKTYNVLNCRGKSNALKKSFAIRNKEAIADGEIGITYFKLNNLQPKDYYNEFINRFVK